jgi:hypothetical protein
VVKRMAAAVLGGALTVGGIALLVLPGPGFVLVAAGLAVLATQFAWAARPLAYAKDKARAGMDEVARSRLRAALAVAAALGLLTTGVVEIAGVDLPLVTTVTAVLLIISGLALVGTVVHARRSGGSPGPGSAEGRRGEGHQPAEDASAAR